MRVRSMRFLLVTAFGLFLSQTAAAQGNDARVTGKVTDQAGQPIGGAQVIVRELPGVGTNTADNGNYTLVVGASRLTGRPMQITARAIGYAPITRSVTRAAGTSTQDFQLVRDPLRHEAVVVTGVAAATEQNPLGFEVGREKSRNVRHTARTACRRWSSRALTFSEGHTSSIPRVCFPIW